MATKTELKKLMLSLLHWKNQKNSYEKNNRVILKPLEILVNYSPIHLIIQKRRAAKVTALQTISRIILLVMKKTMMKITLVVEEVMEEMYKAMAQEMAQEIVEVTRVLEVMEYI